MAQGTGVVSPPKAVAAESVPIRRPELASRRPATGGRATALGYLAMTLGSRRKRDRPRSPGHRTRLRQERAVACRHRRSHGGPRAPRRAPGRAQDRAGPRQSTRTSTTLGRRCSATRHVVYHERFRHRSPPDVRASERRAVPVFHEGGRLRRGRQSSGNSGMTTRPSRSLGRRGRSGRLERPTLV